MATAVSSQFIGDTQAKREAIVRFRGEPVFALRATPWSLRRQTIQPRVSP